MHIMDGRDLGRFEFVQSIFTFLLFQVRDDLQNRMGNQFTEYTAISVRKQLVAGMNYFVKVWWKENARPLSFRVGMICQGHLGTHISLQWRHNGHDSVSNYQPHDCLLNFLFRRRSKKTSKLRVTGLCAGNSPVTGEFPAQRASNVENVSIWWRHHGQLAIAQGYRSKNRVAINSMEIQIKTVLFVYLTSVIAVTFSHARTSVNKWWRFCNNLIGPVLDSRGTHKIIQWTPIPDPLFQLDMTITMMTSSNGNIFRVTGPLCG